MNVSELQATLDAEGFSRASYRINQQPDESTLCVKKQGKIWLVFYFERGTRYDLQRFHPEEAACEYFLNRLRAPA